MMKSTLALWRRLLDRRTPVDGIEYRCKICGGDRHDPAATETIGTLIRALRFTVSADPNAGVVFTSPKGQWLKVDNTCAACDCRALGQWLLGKPDFFIRPVTEAPPAPADFPRAIDVAEAPERPIETVGDLIDALATFNARAVVSIAVTGHYPRRIEIEESLGAVMLWPRKPYRVEARSPDAALLDFIAAVAETSMGLMRVAANKLLMDHGRPPVERVAAQRPFNRRQPLPNRRHPDDSAFRGIDLRSGTERRQKGARRPGDRRDCPPDDFPGDRRRNPFERRNTNEKPAAAQATAGSNLDDLAAALLAALKASPEPEPFGAGRMIDADDLSAVRIDGLFDFRDVARRL